MNKLETFLTKKHGKAIFQRRNISFTIPEITLNSWAIFAQVHAAIAPAIKAKRAADSVLDSIGSRVREHEFGRRGAGVAGWYSIGNAGPADCTVDNEPMWAMGEALDKRDADAAKE